MAFLASRLRVLADEATEAVSVAVHDTANHILQSTKANAPVLTGWLRDSYQKHTVEQLHVIVGSKVKYSIYQEYGTKKMSAQPHLTPAFRGADLFFKKRLEVRLKNLG